MNLENAKILLVDDDPAIIEPIKIFLLRHGIKEENIVARKNGQEGLEEFKRHQFDLVLTDHIMPRKTGLELIADIRQRLESQVPIILLTGNYEEVRERAEEFDVIAFAKPVKLKRVIEEIKNI